MVKTKRFKDERDVGDPVSAAKIYDAQGVDELIFLDITATQEKRSVLFDIIEQVSDECSVPLTVGGGIRTLDDIQNLLKSGADMVTINTAALENPMFIREAVDKFGSQCIVVSIDYRMDKMVGNTVFSHGGTIITPWGPVDWGMKIAKQGAGEILITSIDKEGTMTGYDLSPIKDLYNYVDVPIIANGGVGTLQDLVDGVKIGCADAVAASSIFHFTDQSPIKAKTFMQEAGINVRPIM